MRLLAVCTGNVCRSPAVERLLRASALGETDVTVDSAGTDAMVGAGIHADTLAALRARGAGGDDFTARPLTFDLVKKADLVIALAREHRSRIVQVAPAAVRRTYTLAELARVADRIESADALGAGVAERLETLVLLAPSLRTAPPSPEDDDVDDPISGPPRAHENAVNTIEHLLDRVLRVLTAPDQR